MIEVLPSGLDAIWVKVRSVIGPPPALEPGVVWGDVFLALGAVLGGVVVVGAVIAYGTVVYGGIHRASCLSCPSSRRLAGCTTSRTSRCFYSGCSSRRQWGRGSRRYRRGCRPRRRSASCWPNWRLIYGGRGGCEIGAIGPEYGAGKATRGGARILGAVGPWLGLISLVVLLIWVAVANGRDPYKLTYPHLEPAPSAGPVAYRFDEAREKQRQVPGA